MLDKIIPIGSKKREALKKIFKPILRPILPILRLRIFGKHIFLNRYTRKLPILGGLLAVYEARTAQFHIMKERNDEYAKWLRINKPTQKNLEKQNEAQKSFKRRPLISILVPTYNTNTRHLKDCMDSVLKQSYDNWELCIADDASTHEETKKTIKDYASKDERIKYVLRKENGHICEASNSALKLAKGDYVSLLDHDDILWPNALFEVVKLLNEKPETDFIYTDEDKIDEKGKNNSEPFFKPAWSPEYLRSVNYITHFATLKKELVDKIGGFRTGYEGAQDWDLFLRASRECTNIEHIPKVVYSWRKSETSTAQASSAKEYAYINQKKAIEDDIKNRKLRAEVKWEIPYLMWNVKYNLTEKHQVSIIIPTKDSFKYIEKCLTSIYEKTTYTDFEVVVVDTGSTDEKVWSFYKNMEDRFSGLKIVRWKEKFNFAAVCNFGAQHAKGEYLLFLNNDTEVITKTWVDDLLGYAQLEDAGAVGCKLLYPNNTLQHAGVVLGVGGEDGVPGIAAHLFPAYSDSPATDPAVSLYAGGTRNFAAVTAACVMVNKKKFYEVDGFNPEFVIAFNDIDMCLKLLDKGYRNIYLPHVSLYHYESISVGKLGSKQRDPEQFTKEINLMLKKWSDLLDNDPYYHPAFRRDVANARLKIN